MKNIQKTLALTRISLGFVFLWAFLDKLIGLGFATCRDKVTDAVSVGCDAAWLQGGSPTKGFLSFGTKGPFADMFQSIAGAPWADFLFMAGLLLIGVALIAGVAMKLATFSGGLLLILMYLAVLPAANNPLIDDHIIYTLILAVLYQSNKNQVWGLGSWWRAQPLVKKYKILQ